MNLCAPRLLNPVDNQNISVRPTLDWFFDYPLYTYRPDRFAVQISRSPSFDSTEFLKIVECASQICTYLSLDRDLSAGTTYYWRVWSLRSEESSDFSQTGQFTTASNPPPPIITPVPNDTTPPTVGNYTASASGGTANLVVSNVNDLSGIREVRFSAKYNNQWVGIGTDTNAPYDMNWNMCSSGVPDGDVELGMEVWDNAGNVYIWSQHRPNPHITKSSNCYQPPAQEGVFLYRNTGLSGDQCYVTQDVPSINNYCGNGWNDEVESILVNSSYHFALYKDDQYGGGDPFTGNPTGDLPSEWRNQASSIRVRRTGNAAFTLYSLGDYNGESWPSDRTIYDMGHWRWNDKAQSIRVASGYGVIVCSDADFKSTCARATGPNQWSDINAFAQGLRDSVSSIQVCSGTCPDAGPNPSFYYPTGNQSVDATQPVILRWGGELNQFYVELWGGGIDGRRQFGWTNDVAWNVGVLPVSANPYYWRVKGWRGYGETGWTEGSFYVAVPDTTQPTGTMTLPGRFGYRNGPTTTLKANASDTGSGVERVEFFAWLSDSWELLGTDTTPPYEYVWNISAVREGGLWVSANIVDKAGNNSGLIWDPDWVFFTIDHTPPTSAVLALPETVTDEQFTVRWSGTDNYTPNDLIFYDVQYQLDCTGDWLDWFVMGNLPGASFNGQDGHSYCFRSRAYDLPGNTEAWSEQSDARTQISTAPTLTPTFAPTLTPVTPQPITETPTPTLTPTPTPTDVKPPPVTTHTIYLPSIQQNGNGVPPVIGSTATPVPPATPVALLLSNTLIETCKWAIQMGLSGFTPNSQVTIAATYSEVTCPIGEQRTGSWSQVYHIPTDANGALVVAYLHQGTGSYTYTFTDQARKSASLSFNSLILGTTATPSPTMIPSSTVTPILTPTVTPSAIPTVTPTATSTNTPTPTASPLPAVINWRQLSLGTKPSARGGTGFAYDTARNKLVLFGGTCAGYACGDTWEYDNTAGWQPINTNGPSPREEAVMVYDSNRQRFVLFGGHTWGGGYLADTWEYDGSNWQSIQTANVPIDRATQGMAYDAGRNKVVLYGGWRGDQQGSNILGDTWEYDGSNWSQITTATTPGSRTGLKLVYVPEWGKTLLFGGSFRSGDQRSYPNDTWIYDGQTWRQIVTNNAPQGRYYHQMAYDPVRKAVVLFGGYRVDSGALNDTWEFNGTDWQPITPTTTPPPTWVAGMLYYPPLSGIVMFGGNSPNQGNLQDTMWLYGPEN